MAETKTNIIPDGCAERALMRTLAGLRDIAAPGCAEGFTIDLGTLVTPGAALRGRYTRGDAEAWYDTANHLSLAAAGWTLHEVK